MLHADAQLSATPINVLVGPGFQRYPFKRSQVSYDPAQRLLLTGAEALPPTNITMLIERGRSIPDWYPHPSSTVRASRMRF